MALFLLVTSFVSSGFALRGWPWILIALLPGRHMQPKMNLGKAAACSFNHGKAGPQ